MKQLMIHKLRTAIGSLAAVVTATVLLAPAALAAPAGAGGGGSQTSTTTTVSASSGTPDLVLVAFGAAITIVLLAALRFAVRGLRGHGTAHA